MPPAGRAPAAPAPAAPTEAERLEAERLKARLDAGLDPAVAAGVAGLKDAGFLSKEDVAALIDQRLQALVSPMLEKFGPALEALGKMTAAPVEPPPAAAAAVQKGETE